MAIETDGNVAEWMPADRLGTVATQVPGYELYGRYIDGIFYLALRSALPIGPTTTFWLNTDQNPDSGYLVWGFAAGAEFNINFDSAGVPHLYRNGDGQTLVSDLSYGMSAARTEFEIAIPRPCSARA